jgi:hypothetical protein
MVICGYNKLIMEDKLQIIKYDFGYEQRAEGRNTKRLVQRRGSGRKLETEE